MEEKRENLSGMLAGTLLIISGLVSFAELNIERGFFDYPVMILRAATMLAGAATAAAIMKRRSFWLAEIGTLILCLCRLYKPKASDYIYMMECAVIITILIFYGLRTYKNKMLGLDWSYLAGIGFCIIWIAWQIYFIRGFMNKEMLGEREVLYSEACRKGFCYLLENAALTALLWDVILHTDNKREYKTGMELSRCCSLAIAVVLFVAAAWYVWPAVFLIPAGRYQGVGTPVFKMIILASLAAGLVCAGLALIKRSKKIWIRTFLLLIPVIFLLLFLLLYLMSA